ncbi:MAG: alpha/beta hydrolase fold domain-containing protein [Alphaproteobacteria bacterium]|nr:alpha/beta hydrolase fold domain-containing protein [Alphaproteobacteria bacterium]
MSKVIYQGYDAETLEFQYSPRLAVSDADTILARWASRSETYSNSANCDLDIAYGPSAGEKLDLFKPAADNAPVMIFIHGGYWRALDKRDHAFVLQPFVEAGALVASINYTLCPEATIDEITRQARAACAWVWRNAAAHGGDPSRVHVTGHSAGGHLTAAMAATDWPTFESGLPKDMLKSATPISGLFDLDPILLVSVNNDVHLDPAGAARNSPIKMAPGHDMPMTIAVGGAETEEFRRQSRTFCDSWGGKLGRVDYLETDGHNHFSVIEAMTEAGNPITRKLLDHMGL